MSEGRRRKSSKQREERRTGDKNELGRKDSGAQIHTSDGVSRAFSFVSTSKFEGEFSQSMQVARDLGCRAERPLRCSPEKAWPKKPQGKKDRTILSGSRSGIDILHVQLPGQEREKKPESEQSEVVPF